jgi:hypothetical protein
MRIEFLGLEPIPKPAQSVTPGGAGIVRPYIGILTFAIVVVLLLSGADLAIRSVASYVGRAIEQEYVRGAQTVRLLRRSASLVRRFRVRTSIANVSGGSSRSWCKSETRFDSVG